MPVNAEEDEMVKQESKLTIHRNEDGTEGELQTNPRRLQKTNVNMIEQSSTALWKSKMSGDILALAPEQKRQERLNILPFTLK